MNLGTQKWKKARANFSGVRDDAGRCGTACTRACPWDAHCLPARGEITSFSKKPSFLGNHSKYVAKACSQGHGQGMHPRPRHASKACSQGHGSPLWACSEGRGMQQARARQPPWAGSEGQGMLACMLPRPRHAAKAMACLRGHAGMPLGAGRWARWHAPGRRQQQGPSMHAEGQWQHGEGEACLVGGMPRPWHALGTPTRPWQHLGGLLLPSLDSLFGHLLLFPP